MGASSFCAIFERFNSSLEHIAKTHLKTQYIVHILDAFLFVGPPNSPICQNNLDNFLALCATLGVSIKQEKTEQATPIITFMGLKLDSLNMVARLPEDKLDKVRSLLSAMANKRKVTLRELQSLLGLLNFRCQVVVPGRCFLRRLTDLTKKVAKPHHRITLNEESRRDIAAWKLFADKFNGKKHTFPSTFAYF